MKKLAKVCLFVFVSVFAFIAVAGEKEVKEEPSFICKALPMLCLLETRGGNGGGGEPPEED